jgi:hypothetical protein
VRRSDRIVKLTTDLHPVPRLRMIGAIAPLSNAFTACAGTNLPCTYPKDKCLEDRRWMELVQDQVKCRPLVGLVPVFNLQFIELECYLLVTCLNAAVKVTFKNGNQLLATTPVLLNYHNGKQTLNAKLFVT